jgi:hypothetical protein
MRFFHDREVLIAALRQRGVDYLMSDSSTDEQVSDAELLASLAAHEDARLRSALIALFLLQPALAARVQLMLKELAVEAQAELTARYMAAVYLQMFWHTRLAIYGLETAPLPDLFSAQLGLPAPEEMYGKPGLQALADWHQRQRPVAYNRRVEYELVIEHLIASLKLRARAKETVSA